MIILLLPRVCTAEDSTNYQSRVLESAGIRLHYLTAGEGPAVILLHGYTSNARENWITPGIADALVGTGYQVTLLDQRGHGKTDRPHSAAQYGEEMVKDILRIMKQQQITRAHLVGFSMGAVIANRFGANYPERLKTLTLVAYGQPPVADVFTKELEEEVRQNLKKMGLAEGNDPRALALLSTRWSRWNVPKELLATNKVPGLAVSGAEDHFLPDAKSLANAMQQLELKIIPGNHGSVLASEELRTSLLQFLTQHEDKP